jgi:hypothetical protein
VKDERTLHRAYNDAQGVTAQFNLNLLVRANAELGADFDVDAFSHCAFYDRERQRIEMHLVSDVAQTVHVRGHAFRFEAGERIHTENSHKFTIDGFHAIARRAASSPTPCGPTPTSCSACTGCAASTISARSGRARRTGRLAAIISVSVDSMRRRNGVSNRASPCAARLRERRNRPLPVSQTGFTCVGPRCLDSEP